MRILSIDQAANASGWSYWEDGKLVNKGVIFPSPKSAKGGQRLSSLRKDFRSLLESLRIMAPTKKLTVLIEDPVGDDGAENNWKTMQVLCQVQGMLIQLIHESGCGDPHIISPSSWQFRCGIHKRDRDSRKAGARAFVEKQYGLTDIPQDIIDSICMTYYYMESNKTEESAF